MSKKQKRVRDEAMEKLNKGESRGMTHGKRRRAQGEEYIRMRKREHTRRFMSQWRRLGE